MVAVTRVNVVGSRRVTLNYECREYLAFLPVPASAEGAFVGGVDPGGDCRGGRVMGWR